MNLGGKGGAKDKFKSKENMEKDKRKQQGKSNKIGSENQEPTTPDKKTGGSPGNLNKK